MKKKSQFILALSIGFIVSMIIMSIAIYFGYTSAYSTNVDSFVIKIFGIPIYELVKTGTKYVGTSQGIYMGMFCGICMTIAVIIQTIISKMKHNK